MTAKIIPFPEPSRPPDNAALVHLTIAGTPNVFELDDCSDVVHFFADTSGTCKCGKETWPKPTA